MAGPTVDTAKMLDDMAVRSSAGNGAELPEAERMPGSSPLRVRPAATHRAPLAESYLAFDAAFSTLTAGELRQLRYTALDGDFLAKFKAIEDAHQALVPTPLPRE